MGLSNYQLVLLDNLIYLEEVTRVIEKQDTIGDIVNRLLYKDGDSSNGVGTGTIKSDCNDPYKVKGDNCLMNLEEWKDVLLAIKNDETLCSLTIHSVENDREDGFRAMALTGENIDENIIIFKGTTSANEWIDNGIGGYSLVTSSQQRALDFVKGIDIVNNKSFVTSGHSKGGNMAQYVALFCDEPPIDRCLNYDGQGFSEELCATQAYKDVIERKGDNLYTIASCGDYVNVLFNPAVPEEHRMYLEANDIGLVIDYHKPNNILKKEKGVITGLNNLTSMKPLSYFIYQFIDYVQKTEHNVENKKAICDGLMGCLAATAEDDDDMELCTKVDLALVGIIALPLLASIFNVGTHDMPLEDAIAKLISKYESDEYRGALYEIMGKGTIDALVDCLREFVSYSPQYAMAVTYTLEDMVNGGYDDELGFVFSWILESVESVTNLNFDKFKADISEQKVISTTLGEGSKGNVYTYITEEGELYHEGSAVGESIYGTVTSDSIYGGNGRDTIRGESGDDLIVGGRGDDTLYGGSGVDTYLFHMNDGHDVIYNDELTQSYDIIRFAEDVSKDDVKFAKGGHAIGNLNDLVISVGENSSIIVKKFFYQNNDGNYDNAIDVFWFNKDGDYWTLSDVLDMLAQPKSSDEYDEKIEDLIKTMESGAPVSGNGSSSGALDMPSSGNNRPSPSEEEGEESEDEETETDEIKNYWGIYVNALIAYPKDPLIVDLNGDETFTTNIENGTHFDYNGDGFAEKTAWISQGDGLLVRDVNQNGSIDNGTELFGDRTVLKDGTVAKSGFQALEDLDDNQDGVINYQDTEYTNIRVWMDFDMDGKSNDHELFTLDSLGIDEIQLDDKKLQDVDEHGNTIMAEGEAHGYRTFALKEYGLDVDYADTQYQGDLLDVSLLDDGMPEIKGRGRLMDLSQAMLRNDELRILVTDWMNEDNYYQKLELVDQILCVWTQAQDIADGSRGSYMDAKKLHVIENVCGLDFEGVDGANPNAQATAILKDIYKNISADVMNCLLSQVNYQAALDKLQITFDEESQTYICDFVVVYQTLISEHSESYVAHFTKYILENTKIGKYFTNEDICNQLIEADVQYASFVMVDNYVIADDNKNEVNGTQDNNLILGALGNDKLYGKEGHDIYLFYAGDGQDTIYDTQGVDRIVFGEGIAVEDIQVTRNSFDLYLTNRVTGDKVTVNEFFRYVGKQIEEVEFADGTKWSYEVLLDKARYYYGTDGVDVVGGANSSEEVSVNEENYMYGGAGNDTLYGYNGDDELHGETGHDQLYGGVGDDRLIGGRGSDKLYGNEGNDTYIFHAGDGQDTIYDTQGVDRIVFGEGIAAEDIQVTRNSFDLYLTNRVTGDKVTINEFFRYAGKQIEEVEFADGTKWSYEALIDKARYYYGTDGVDVVGGANGNNEVPIIEENYMYAGAGNDTLRGQNGNDELHGETGYDQLYGGIGDDRLIGGQGSDKLYGEEGNDTYIFHAGDGQDTIYDTQGVDRIVFGEGIAVEDIQITRNSFDLYLTNRVTGDKVTVNEFFRYAGKQIEEVEFADGTKWSYEALIDKARYYYGTDGVDVVVGTNSNDEVPIIEENYMYGGAGNDTLRGQNGNDELHGETGYDQLYGGIGDDRLIGGQGSDKLYGEEGNDTYIFHAGDGQDTISENGGIDTIVFGDNIGIEDLIFSKRGNDLNISLVGQEDKITISNYYYSDAYKVESFQTADGSVLDYSKIDLMIQAMASFEDATGMMWEEAVQSQNEQANDIINQWWTKE